MLKKRNRYTEIEMLNINQYVSFIRQENSVLVYT